MAAPTLDSAGCSNVTNLGAVALVQPTTPVLGALFFCVIAHRNVAVGTPTPSETAGYTGWNCPWGTVTTGATFLTVWYSVFTSTTPTAPTISDSGDHQQHRCFQVSHALGTPEINAYTTGVETPGDTSGSFVGPTTTQPECLVILMGSSDTPDLTNTTEFSANANASLTSLTLTWATLGNAVATGGGSGKLSFFGTLASAGSSGTFTYTKATSGVKAHLAVAISPPIVPNFHLGANAAVR